ncbi:MAG: type II toxin-antitoxin system RelE/ParE family toxin [Cyclobacteriaceae bacterium]
MIQNFKSKSLKRLFEKGDASKVVPAHVSKLRRILARLNAADRLEDMNYPGSDLHQLTGNLKGHQAVKVSGNWRVIFRFENGDAYDVDYDDYH